MRITELQNKARELIKDVKPTANTGYNKYLNVDYEIKSKHNMVEALGLDVMSPKKILDISTCYGWMAWILKHFGHALTVTDNLNDKITNPPIVRELLGLPEAINFSYPSNRKKTIMNAEANNDMDFYCKYKPLPVTEKFDVIIAGSVAPHSYFSEASWHKFIKNCMKHLKQRGFIYISPNTSPGMDQLSEAVKQYKAEAILRGWKINK